MINVAVFPIIDFDRKPHAPLTRLMSERLERYAADLQLQLEKSLPDVGNCENLMVYISYTGSYAIRWIIANDVPEEVAKVVTGICAELGYISWKKVDFHQSDDPSRLL
jgi:hypothetical protein